MRHDRKALPLPFGAPSLTGSEIHDLQCVLESGRLSGNGPFTLSCHQWLEDHTGCARALLTHSGTAALEMAVILAGIGPGDEVILPSFTFSSCANATILRGAVPVFVDIRDDTLNLDETLIEQAITSKTRAVMPVHYAGVACALDEITAVARQHDLLVIEDAAQALLATYKGKPLGSIGDFGAYSFHETKNITCGEGGALIVNRAEHAERAEIVWEKGTDRSRFQRGEVDKYTWRDLGSSYLPSELNAALLSSQLTRATEITKRRLERWDRYHGAFLDLENKELLRRPVIPPSCAHNGHIYYVLLPTAERRDRMMVALKERGIPAAFHYVPLHGAPAGRRYGRIAGSMANTEDLAARLLRLPLYGDMTSVEQRKAIEAVHDLAST